MKIFNIQTYVCRVGENAVENWELLEQSKDNYVFFHLSAFSSCYLILECYYKNICDIPVNIIIKAAEICKSKTKYKNLSNIRVDYTFCSNVKRGEIVGEIVYKSNKKVKNILI